MGPTLVVFGNAIVHGDKPVNRDIRCGKGAADPEGHNTVRRCVGFTIDCNVVCVCRWTFMCRT